MLRYLAIIEIVHALISIALITDPKTESKANLKKLRKIKEGINLEEELENQKINLTNNS